jgi:hypothetical protein
MTDRDDRAARALRTALTEQAAEQDGAVDLGAVHRRARRRRVSGAAAVVAAVAAVVLGAVAIPQLWQPEPSTVAQPASATPRTESQPSPWRTEQYRSISFEVPSDWGYADAPGADWCAATRDERAATEQPYVSLGARRVVREIACDPVPDSLLSEHVEVFPHPAAATVVEGTSRRGDWWVVQRVVDEGEDAVVVKVVSRDQQLAERIAGTARLAEEEVCAAESPVQAWGARPPGPAALPTDRPVDDAVICQYDPADPSAAGGLRARAFLRGSQAEQLLRTLTSAPPASRSCAGTGPAEIALTVRVLSPAPSGEVYVTARGCPDQPQAIDGGIDDGQSLRTLTREACRQLLVPPIRLETASEGLARSCLS